MKRSEINEAVRRATVFFQEHGWYLPPDPEWDVTDFGLGCFQKEGLVLLNLAMEPEYSEKLMFAEKFQRTPAHYHLKKKEDIICRNGNLVIQVWPSTSLRTKLNKTFQIQINNRRRAVLAGESIILLAGERITLEPGIYHTFYPESEGCVISEISTANDDEIDNYFENSNISRFTVIDENEMPLVKLVSDL